MFQIIENEPEPENIKLVFLGSRGKSVLKELQNKGFGNINAICVSTDGDTLVDMEPEKVLYACNDILEVKVGSKSTGFLLPGEKEKVCAELEGANIVFIIVDLDDKVSSKTAPIIASIAKGEGALTIGLVVVPSQSEISQVESRSIFFDLKQYLDSIAVISCEEVAKTISLDEEKNLYQIVSALTCEPVKGITELLTNPGIINVDIADIFSLLKDSDKLLWGTGKAKGKKGVVEAMNHALRSPMLENISFQDVPGCLINITAGETFTIDEFADIADGIEEYILDSAMIVIGTVIDQEMKDEINVTVFLSVEDSNKLEIQEDLLLDSQEVPVLFRMGSEISLDSFGNELNIVTSSDTSDVDIAELINHLSNVYRSVGGDELIVRQVKDLPPKPATSNKRGSLGGSRSVL